MNAYANPYQRTPSQPRLPAYRAAPPAAPATTTAFRPGVVLGAAIVLACAALPVVLAILVGGSPWGAITAFFHGV